MEDRELKKLQNHLLAAEENTAPRCRVYNGDKTDVDMEEYALQVDTPARHRSKAGFLVLLLLAAVAVTVYILLGGKLPWN